VVSELQGLTLQIEKDQNKKNKMLAVSNENKKWGKGENSAREIPRQENVI